jgi:two-component sensor histidine kinase/CHASE1-domain containing sensor protein
MDRSLQERVRKQAWIVRHSRTFPFLVFALSIVTVIASVFAAETAERHAIRQMLVAQVAELNHAIMGQEATFTAVLQVSTLYLSKVNVSQNEFDAFSRSASLAVDYEAARGVGWGKVILDPKSRAIASVVVEYLSPLNDANQRALGYDMYSDTRRRQAMDIAAQTRIPATTAPVVLKQDEGSEKRGFLVYKSVPDEAKIPKGFVYVAFDGEAFLRKQLAVLAYEPDYAAIYDGSISDANLLAKVGRPSPDYYIISDNLRFGNRNWVLVIGQATPSVLARSTLWLFLFGLVVSGLLLSLTHIIIRSSMRDRIAFAWQSRQLRIRKTLNQELNHRVKNTLANVLSIISLTRRNAENIDEFEKGLIGRIRALSSTHGLLTQTEWSNASIREICEAELAPFLGSTAPTISIKGDDIELSPDTALSLGLAIHELATNASKYGALSCGEGHIDVEWTMNGNGQAKIQWTETGGPKVEMPQRRGFGLELLEAVVATELGRAVEVKFDPKGVRCTLLLPVEPLPKNQKREPVAAAQ